MSEEQAEEKTADYGQFDASAGQEPAAEPQGEPAAEPEGEVSILESIAAESGWAPEDQWRGDKAKWKDAETFIREGVKIQSKQHDKIDRLQDSVKSVEKNLKDMAASEAKRTRAALESQKERLATERQEAFNRQDAKGFEAADEELRNTESQLAEEDDQAKVAQEFEDTFKERNNWYQEDKAMTAYALQSAQHLKSAFPDIDQDSYMQELERTVKAQFPNEFTNPNREAGSMAGGDKPASEQQISSGKKKSFDSLPREAKEAFQELNQYMPANAKMTKAAYVKSYFEEIA